MPRRKRKNLNIGKVLMASAAGGATIVVSEIMEDNIPALQDKQWASPLIMEALGTTLLYFGGEDLEPVAYGVLGAAGGDLAYQGYLKAKENMNGTSSVDPGMNAARNKLRVLRKMYKGGRRPGRRPTSSVDPGKITRPAPGDYGKKMERLAIAQTLEADDGTGAYC